MPRLSLVDTPLVNWADPTARVSDVADRRIKPEAGPPASTHPTSGTTRLAINRPWHDLYSRLRATSAHLNTGALGGSLLHEGDKEDLKAYDVFCVIYAPKIWGIILLANLPVTHSEEILLKTFASAWEQRRQHPFSADHWLSRLIHLAHKEGLPVERVQAILRAQLTPNRSKKGGSDEK